MTPSPHPTDDLKLIEELEKLGKEAERSILKTPNAVWSDRTYLAPKDYPRVLLASTRLRELVGERDTALEFSHLTCASDAVTAFAFVKERRDAAEAALTEALKERDAYEAKFLEADGWNCELNAKLVVSKARTERLEGALRTLSKPTHGCRYWEVAATALQTASGTLSESSDGWEPIETAPRDGTSVLIALTCQDGRHESAVGEAYWYPDRGWWRANTTPDDDFDNSVSGTSHCQITHWRPLPSPPPKDTPNDT